MKEHPQGWRYAALRHVGQITNGATPTSSEPSYWDGDLPWATPEDLGSLRGRDLASTARQITDAGYRACGTSFVPPGSIILSTRAPIGHLAIARTSMCFNQGCRAVSLRAGHVPEFFYFQLHAMRDLLASFGQGSTFQELSRDKLAAFRVLIPPTREQQAIADFLDRETARIDALVAKQGAFLALLSEQKQALITEAVTRGIGAGEVLSPTGLDWLPQLPRHWTQSTVGHVTLRITYGFTNPMPTTDDGPLLLTANDVGDGHILVDSARRTTADAFANHLTEKSRPKPGDVLVTKDGTLGRTAVFRGPPACINQSVALLRPKSGVVSAEFLEFFLRSAPAQAKMNLDAGGTTIKHIYITRLAKMMCPVPPNDEQVAIVSSLEYRLGKLEIVAAKARDMSRCLREHRAALITAAVTGGIAAARPLADQGPARAAAA